MKLVETLPAERQLIVQMPEVGRCRPVSEGRAAGPARSAHGLVALGRTPQN
jgi:hypothetical protein